MDPKSSQFLVVSGFENLQIQQATQPSTMGCFGALFRRGNRHDAAAADKGALTANQATGIEILVHAIPFLGIWPYENGMTLALIVNEVVPLSVLVRLAFSRPEMKY